MSKKKPTVNEVSAVLLVAIRAKENGDAAMHRRALEAYAGVRAAGFPAPVEENGQPGDSDFRFMNARLPEPIVTVVEGLRA